MLVLRLGVSVRVVLGLELKSELAPELEILGYETPGYEKVGVRNVWKPYKLPLKLLS